MLARIVAQQSCSAVCLDVRIECEIANVDFANNVWRTPLHCTNYVRGDWDARAPTGGTQTDDTVFAAALDVARPCAAHLEFYHQRLPLCEAAVRSPHVRSTATGSRISAWLTSTASRSGYRNGAISIDLTQYPRSNR